ncbi:hypothetical protein KM043_004101 [Ampulex compressa]|nr:hypothetical protein KM043_004101 [Ampulex compressa]
MSTSIQLVLALSFLLAAAPAGSEEMMDPFALIRETLKYWRSIYKAYQEEMTLGYCWAEYTLGMQEESPDMTQTRAIQNRPTARSRGNGQAAGSKAIGYRLSDIGQSTERIFQKRIRLERSSEPILSTRFNDGAGVQVSNDSRGKKRKRENDVADKRKHRGNILELEDPRGRRVGLDKDAKRNASRLDESSRGILLPRSVFERKQGESYYGFLSPPGKGRIVTGLSDPKFGANGAETDWKASSRSELRGWSLVEEDMHRKVLYPKMIGDTPIHVDSLKGRSFSLKLSRPGQRKMPFDHRISPQRILPRKLRGSKALENLESETRERYENCSNSVFDKQERIDAIHERNTKPCEMPEVRIYSGGLLEVSPHREVEARRARRQIPTYKLPGDVDPRPTKPDPSPSDDRGSAKVGSEFRKNGAAQGKKMDLSPPHSSEGNGQGGNSQIENNIERWSGLMDSRRRHRAQPYVEGSFLVGEQVLKKSRKGRKEAIRPPRGGPSLRRARDRRFMVDYEGSTSGSSRNSRTRSSSRRLQDQGRRSSNVDFEARGVGRTTMLDQRPALLTPLKILGLFVHVGRRIMTIFDGNKLLDCTREYFWKRFLKWLDE